LTQTSYHANAYIGRENPEVDFSNCLPSISCVQYCAALTQMSQESASSSDVQPLQELRKELPPFCRKRNNRDGEERCWDTSKIRCWNEYGGNQVFDGVKEWTLLRHYQHDDTTQMRWMHLFHDDWDLIYFGWGYVKPIDTICEQMKKEDELLELIRIISDSKNVVIAGHSEGSGWAFCFNQMLEERNFPIDRFLIATGVLVGSQKLMDKMSDYTKANSLYLLVENRLPEFMIGGLMPDVYTLISAVEGPTFPSFGYSCDEQERCLGFSLPINLESGVKRAEALYDNPMTRSTSTSVLQEIHDFENYRKCFRACKSLFSQAPNFNYQINTPSYYNRPPKPPFSLPHCNFC